MMKQYIQNLQAKSPHEQRGHAVRLAGGLTIVIFFVWLTALGVHLSLSTGSPTRDVANSNETVNTDTSSADQSQLANVVSAVPGGAAAGSASASGNTLVVASSTDASLVNSQ